MSSVWSGVWTASRKVWPCRWAERGGGGEKKNCRVGKPTANLGYDIRKGKNVYSASKQRGNAIEDVLDRSKLGLLFFF